MIASNELERADILELANVASALRKTLRQYEKAHTLSNHKEVLDRGRQLIGKIVAGSLKSPQEEVQRLLPEGAGLYESVRAYGYAVRILAQQGESEDSLEKALKLYERCICDISEGKPYQDWPHEEVKALEEFISFLRALERILIGELNSRRAADLMHTGA